MRAIPSEKESPHFSCPNSPDLGAFVVGVGQLRWRRKGALGALGSFQVEEGLEEKSGWVRDITIVASSRLAQQAFVTPSVVA